MLVSWANVEAHPQEPVQQVDTQQAAQAMGSVDTSNEAPVRVQRSCSVSVARYIAKILGSVRFWIGSLLGIDQSYWRIHIHPEKLAAIMDESPLCRRGDYDIFDVRKFCYLVEVRGQQEDFSRKCINLYGEGAFGIGPMIGEMKMPVFVLYRKHDVLNGDHVFSVIDNFDLKGVIPEWLEIRPPGNVDGYTLSILPPVV